MNNANLNVLRQNTGNMATAQAPNSNNVPSDLASLVAFMQPQIELFRESSTPETIMMDTQTVKFSTTTTFRIVSVGLGERMIHKIVGSIALVNALAGAQVVQISKQFPYNIIQNISTSINGSTAIQSASAYAYLVETARRNVYFNLNPLSTRVCSVTAGANVTLTAGSGTLSGFTSLSIAASTTGILNFTFYFETSFVLNRNDLIGMLPLQNSSTYATVIYNAAPSALGIDDSAPLYVAAAIPGTLSVGSATNITAQARYDFWTVPADFTLYQDLISNSFQIIEMPNQPLTSTGVGALKMSFPLNSYLLAATLIVRNASNALVQIDNVLSNLYMQYNGNITPFRSDYGIHAYTQYADYRNDFTPYGTVLWDGTNTAEELNQSDAAGWVDLYNTSNPALIGDVIAASITVPATYSFVRTQIVPSNVNVTPNK